MSDLEKNSSPQRAIVVLNPKAGCALKPGCVDQLESAARALGADTVHISDDTDIGSLAAQWSTNGIQIVGVAGGDGTISSVAHAISGSNMVLLPIPFGTLNHFCQDVGTPDDPLVAVRALDSQLAEEKLVDVGNVNGRLFLNNSSLGLYPHLVRRREKRQHVLGKWMAYAVAAFEFLRHPVRLKVQLNQEENGQPFHAGLIFVSNNAIEEGLWAAGRRSRMDSGALQLFVLKEGTVLATFRAAVAFLRGRSDKCPVLNEHRLRDFQVLVKHRKLVRVSCDGETIRLQPPINYRILPRALRVRTLKADAFKVDTGDASST